MPNRTGTDERKESDHSGRPTTRAMPGDLRSPSGGTRERPDERNESRVGGASRQEYVTPLDSANHAVSARRNSRVRRLDSRGSANK